MNLKRIKAERNLMSFLYFQKQSGLRNKATFFGAIGILLAVVLACESNKTTNINSTSQTTTPKLSPTEATTNSAIQQITPKPTSTVAAYKSGGLGLDRAAWESSHGNALADGTSFFRYENDKFAVMFSAGNANHIERAYGDRNAVPIADARTESKLFIPADAKFVRTYTSRSDSTVELYTSESLKSRFSESNFIGGKAGDFIVLYRNQTGKVMTFIATIGNNP